MTNSTDKDNIMSRLGNLNNAEEIYRKISVRNDNTIEERDIIKEWGKKAEQKNKEENTHGRLDIPQKRSSLGENHQAIINSSTKNDREDISVVPFGNSEVNKKWIA